MTWAVLFILFSMIIFIAVVGAGKILIFLNIDISDQITILTTTLQLIESTERNLINLAYYQLVSIYYLIINLPSMSIGVYISPKDIPSLLYKFVLWPLNMWRERQLKNWVKETIDEKLQDMKRESQEMRKEQQSIRNDMQAMEKRFDEKIQDIRKDIRKIINLLESKGSKDADE